MTGKAVIHDNISVVDWVNAEVWPNNRDRFLPIVMPISTDKWGWQGLTIADRSLLYTVTSMDNARSFEYGIFVMDKDKFEPASRRPVTGQLAGDLLSDRKQVAFCAYPLPENGGLCKIAVLLQSDQTAKALQDVLAIHLRNNTAFGCRGVKSLPKDSDTVQTIYYRLAKMIDPIGMPLHVWHRRGSSNGIYVMPLATTEWKGGACKLEKTFVSVKVTLDNSEYYYVHRYPDTTLKSLKFVDLEKSTDLKGLLAGLKDGTRRMALCQYPLGPGKTNMAVLLQSGQDAGDALFEFIVKELKVKAAQKLWQVELAASDTREPAPRVSSFTKTQQYSPGASRIAGRSAFQDQKPKSGGVVNGGVEKRISRRGQMHVNSPRPPHSRD